MVAFESLLHNSQKLIKIELKHYLEGEEAFIVRKPLRKTFKTRKPLVYHIDNILQINLTDINKYKAYNDGF